MRLIVGGVCQGKLDYGKSLTGTDEGGMVADGSTDGYEQAFQATVINKFHGYIKRISKSVVKESEQIEAEAFLRKFIYDMIKQNPQVIVIMDEVGCGIVPIDPSERAYRELAGRAGQLLAKEADQVHRVICGIGTRIK